MRRFSAVSLCFHWIVRAVLCDISHFFASDYAGSFAQPQLTYPVQTIALQPAPVAPQHSLPSLYGPPAQEQPENIGYPATPASTHAPVAPLPQVTTEFTLPEVVENRAAKDGRANFIPLRAQYLPPPVEERPNYEVPARPAKPPYHSSGYYYPRPTGIAFTTSTTTVRPNPIVVAEPPQTFPDPPISNDPIVVLQPPNTGYDYNVPPVIPPTLAQPTHTPSTPAPVYLPPAAGDGSDAVVHPDHTNNALRLRIKEMRCMQHGSGYFRAVLKVDNFISAAPTVDNDANDKRCELKLSRSFVVVDISAVDFQQCGVQSCGKDLCLRLRFPAIRGMRTDTDAILTLHCKTQQRVAVKTHALKMGVTNELQARSLGTYAHGGTQLPFRTHVELLRRSGNGFIRLLEAQNAVQLGEELLLRAHVIAGDGWNFTKLSDVLVQRISPSGEVLNNAALITAQGCINPSMQSICTQPPIYDPPLGHRLAFKAVMFQGMRSGEELVISMRITGCLEAHECYVDGQHCNDGSPQQWRRKRNISVGVSRNEQERVANTTEVSEITRIAFRVIIPVMEGAEDNNNSTEKAGNTTDEPVINVMQQVSSNRIKLISSLGFVLLLCSLGVVTTLKLAK